jgi:hypothetical protein
MEEDAAVSLEGSCHLLRMALRLETTGSAPFFIRGSPFATPVLRVRPLAMDLTWSPTPPAA